MAMTLEQQKAIDKLNFEIANDVKKIISIATHSGIGEILYFLHYLHFIRLIEMEGEVPDDEKNITYLYVWKLEDAYKYIIQMLYKYGNNKQFINSSEGYINPDVTKLLSEYVLLINSKYENLGIFTLFSDIEVSGERDQYIKVNMESVKNNERLHKFLLYASRVDKDNDFQTGNIKTKEDFLDYFNNEYLPYSDLFEQEFELGLEHFIEAIDFIIGTIINQINTSEKTFAHFENGKINVKAEITIINFGLSLFIKKQLILDKFGSSINSIIKRLTFNPTKFYESQLRYNLISRQPLLDFDEYFLVSPELLLDSLLINSHYTLLESDRSIDEYKRRYSEKFIDKIKETASRYDFIEVARGLELYDGKNQLGDIDIVLKNSANHFLLIESKNHTIPLDVYFHDQEATEKRLEYLVSEWENKVKKRSDYIQKHYSKYGISETFSYLIISKYPEILSHFSKYLVLTMKEFDYWLSQSNISLKFQEIFEVIYESNEESFTQEQIKIIQKDLMPECNFSQE